MMEDRHMEQPEITHHDVTAVVKWFNTTKGFGFVQMSDGSPDAFLHISVVEQSGNRELYEGTEIVCDLCQGRKGLQVASIQRITAMPDGPPPSSDGGRGGGYGGETQTVEGTVKFFNMEKGFGFVIPDDGSKDVFVSARTLERIGLNSLQADQRVRLQIRSGQKGPMAEHVEPI